jgi:hypothetical protein
MFDHRDPAQDNDSSLQSMLCDVLAEPGPPMCGIVWNMDPVQNLFNVVLTPES